MAHGFHGLGTWEGLGCFCLRVFHEVAVSQWLELEQSGSEAAGVWLTKLSLYIVSGLLQESPHVGWFGLTARRLQGSQDSLCASSLRQECFSKAEAASPFLTYACKSHCITSTTFYQLQMNHSLPRLKESGHRPHP